MVCSVVIGKSEGKRRNWKTKARTDHPMSQGKILWHEEFTPVPVFFLFLSPDHRLYIVKNMYVYTYRAFHDFRA